MTEAIRYIDISTWTGNWPFIPLSYNHYDDLKKKLRTRAVQHAMISPIEAILERDPLRANLQLIRDTAQDDFYSPVPIIDLSYANWEENIEIAVQDKRVKMIKLVPNYHKYELEWRRMEELIAHTQQHNWTIGIQIRIEDPRSQHPLMKVPDVNVERATQVAVDFPEQRFVFHNLYLGELSTVLMAPAQIFVDTASLETEDVLHFIWKRYTLDRVLFSSHAPFYYLEGNTFKYQYTDTPLEHVQQVAAMRAADLWKIDITSYKESAD